MAQLLLTAGETLLMRAALKRRLAELGRPDGRADGAVAQVEHITRLLQRLATAGPQEPVQVLATDEEALLIAQSLDRSAAWQRSLLPHARDQGVLASLCRKVYAAAGEQPSSLTQRLARGVGALLRRGAP